LAAGAGAAISRGASALLGSLVADVSAGIAIAGIFGAVAVEAPFCTGVIGPLTAGAGGTGAVAAGSFCAEAAVAPSSSAARDKNSTGFSGLLVTVFTSFARA